MWRAGEILYYLWSPSLTKSLESEPRRRFVNTGALAARSRNPRTGSGLRLGTCLGGQWALLLLASGSGNSFMDTKAAGVERFVVA